MASVGIIPKAQGGRMGHQDVDIPSPEHTVEYQLGHHLEHSEEHFILGELMFALVVLHGTAKACNDQIMLIVVQHLPIDKVSPEGRQQLHPTMGIGIHVHIGIAVLDAGTELVQVLKVMVSKYKVEGFVQGRKDELIVFQGKVTRGDDQIDIGIP